MQTGICFVLIIEELNVESVTELFQYFQLINKMHSGQREGNNMVLYFMWGKLELIWPW